MESRKLTRTASLLIAILITLPLCGAPRHKKAGDGFKDYTVQNAGVGKTGIYLVNITTRSAKPDVGLEMAAKNAVHAVLFKGVPAGGGFSAQAPVAGKESAEEENPVFFENFFMSDYKNFVADVVPGSLKIERQADKSYRTSGVVAILKDDLRRYLEENKIINSLVVR